VRANSGLGLNRGRFAAVLVLAVAGFSAIVGQIVLIRELIILFNGNELSVGMMLGIWLLWTAAGSVAIARVVSERKDVRKIIALIECLCGLSLPLTVVAVRLAGTVVRTVPDELLGIGPMLSISTACLSVFCGLSGCLFVLGVRLYRQSCGVTGQAGTSYGYLVETAGAGLGGILTSILLLRFLGSLQIAVIVTVLNLAVAIWLMAGRGRARGAILVLSAVVATALLAVYVAPRVEDATQRRLWQGFQVVDSRDTIYGRLTVVEAGGMRSIYDNGSILANVPDPAAAEEAVHFALLEHAAPHKVLLIGGGVNGSITEALKHPTIERVDYVELDPTLIAVFRQHFPAEASAAFSDSRVHVHLMDGRIYLKTTTARFDAIIVNVPSPETAQLNRFYTEEFFRIARDHLTRGGVLALQLRSSEDYIGPELAEFLRCIHKTLRSVFPEVAVIPGDTLHMFAAGAANALTEDPGVLVARLRERDLKTSYVREYFLPYRMSAERMGQIKELLRPLQQTRMNRDFQPAAYYFGAVLWSAQFKSGYARVLERAAGVQFSSVWGAVAALSLLLFVIIRWIPRSARGRAGALWSVGATGYTLMALQILLILAFQSLYGYVYKELAMTIGMFMAGIAIGTWLAVGRADDELTLARRSAWNQFLLAICAPLLLVVMMQLTKSSGANTSASIAGILFPVMAALAGIPGGYQFPLAAASYFRGKEMQAGYGALYAVDLIGGCVGALALAGILIPVFGLWDVAWLTALVNAAPALLFSVESRSRLVQAR
jgi:spermidine synthase